MDRMKNLKMFKTGEERTREIGRAGGIARGEAMRRRATLRKLAQAFLDSKCIDALKLARIKEEVPEMAEAFEVDNRFVLIHSLFQRACEGNMKAYAELVRLSDAQDSEDNPFGSFNSF